MMNVVIDKTTYEVLVQQTSNGSLVFNAPREFYVSVVRQAIPTSGQTPFSAMKLIPLMEHALYEQFFPTRASTGTNILKRRQWGSYFAGGVRLPYSALLGVRYLNDMQPLWLIADCELKADAPGQLHTLWMETILIHIFS